MKTAESDNECRGCWANPIPRANRRWRILFALALLGLISARTAGAQDGLFDSKAQIQGLAVPIFLNTNTTPAAVIRVKAITHDFQTRGFFRIGVLPLLILDGVSVEVRDASQLRAILARSKRLLNSPRRNEAIQARDFSLCFCSRSRALLRAKQVHPEDSLRWRMEQGTLAKSNGRVVHFEQGFLTVAGPKAGVLCCQTTNGPIRISLFSPVLHKLE